MVKSRSLAKTLSLAASATNPTTVGTEVRWGVSFVITQDAAKHFADVAYGKANYPVDLFLDRAEDAVVIVSPSVYTENFSKEETDTALTKVLGYGNSNLVVITNFTNTTSSILAMNKSNAVVAENETELIAWLKANNITVVTKSATENTPTLSKSKLGDVIVEEWPAIGLLSAPVLSESLASGTAGQMYNIEGPSPGATAQERTDFANNEMSRLKSILSGGALPVRIELGSTITVPPSLGREFLNYSVIGMVAAAIVVALIVLLRYRVISHIAPLLFIAASQMIILVCILGGVGTLDLSTIAGLFGSLGISVDAQIIVTDELLSKKLESKDDARRRLNKAFYIVTRDASILLLVMLPLLFSNLVEIIGFVTATMLGSILGVIITTQTYSAVIEARFKE